jgi:hypothetical protein
MNTHAQQDRIARSKLRFLDQTWGRKLTDWADAPEVSARSIDSVEVKHPLPVFRPDVLYGRPTLDGTTPAGTDFVDNDGLPQVFLLVDFEGDEDREYLIDTEGYGYARHVVRIVQR